jgi:hypothetical protein
VIDARVEANLIQQDDASFTRRTVERPHAIADVASGNQMPPLADAFLSHLDVVDVGQEADDKIGIGDQTAERVAVATDVKCQRPALGMITD